MDEIEALRSRLAALLERVRQASRDGAVLRLDEDYQPSGAAEVAFGEAAAGTSGAAVSVDETGAPGTSGAGVSPAALIALAAREHVPDLAIVYEGRHAYLYSTRHMTRQYAEMAARIAEGNILRLIAEAVRADSATYPRPTPVGTFVERPFGLAADQITLALAHMLTDPCFDDIHRVTASDGTLFLFSTRHLEPAHAASLAEWLAVGRSNNP
jgi:hypothetical protein